tara:strand:+ start:23 stop:1675 length:1653 start_codon:yes stop_codon:yes gene_type:complete
MKLMAINEQMEMAFNDQAPQVDPVSGNEIPPGSLPEEVRDDIDARLSEGEYVVPADVVRFFGVKYFEDLRTEAKLGLSGMESDGRIGGEPMAVDPSGMPPEGMDISEEDIAALEQALTTGVANGGLMDKMARVAKYDPLVNARMNAGGLIVGFAEGGGAVQSLYNDPTRIDSLIQKVTAAAQSNPSLMGELAKRGVSVNTTQANMDPNAMQQANNKVQAFAPGGDVAPTFNAASFPLGFSTFGPSAPGMEGVTTQVAYYNPTTGENRSFAHYSSTNAPAEPIPAGFIMGSAPATSTAGVQAAVASGQVIDTNTAPGGDKDQNRFMQELMDRDTDKNSWMSKYNYDDPDTMIKEMKDSIDDKETMFQKTITRGPFTNFIGNSIYLNKARQVNANIEWLKTIGKTDEAADLKVELDKYVEDRDVTGDITEGNYNVNDILAERSKTTIGQQQKIAGNAARNAAADAERNKKNAGPKSIPWYKQTETNIVSGQASGGDKDQNRAMEALMTRAKAETDLSDKNKAYAKKTKSNEDYFVGNEGGLVSRPKKKNKKK